jgi:hypothetical protein
VTAETIERAVQELVAVYGDGVRVAREGGRALVRLPDVVLYPGCRPEKTAMLLVFDPNQPKPIPYVEPGQLLATGKTPKSISTVMVGGESWMQYSFNIPWAEGASIIRFVAAARQRFAQDE